MALSRGRLPAGDHPPTDDLASRYAAGTDGGSGMVSAGAPVEHTDPNAGGRVDDLGGHVVHTSPQGTDDLRPIPGVVTRAMHGGLRTAHHPGLLVETPHFNGSHVALSGRVSVLVLAPTEQLEPDNPEVLPSLRQPPPSDPYGRMCANAQAAKGL